MGAAGAAGCRRDEGLPRLLPGGGGLTAGASGRSPNGVALARTKPGAHEKEARGRALRRGCDAARRE
ncbi:hypothetical protein NDU88_002515 [Pleurodeles waltl]|uniref:Uncharacterized protein n=1 Tax=Pleurodeles waltl TaxID=8319 RepID=A0AAV7P758_PLEWA|nr:hypothetical protein NDU88_002515 [Pleurodeles waltl]